MWIGGAIVLANSRVGKKFQTVLPLQIRKSLNLHEGDVLIWEPTEEGDVRVRAVPSYTEYLKSLGGQIWTTAAEADSAVKEEDQAWD